MNLDKMPDLLKGSGREISQDLIRSAASNGTPHQRDAQVAMIIFSGVHSLAQHIKNLESQGGMSRAEAVLSVREAIENEVEYLDGDGGEPEFLDFEKDEKEKNDE